MHITQNHTEWFIIIWLSVIAAYDIYCWRDGVPNNTISHVVVKWSILLAWLPLAVMTFVVLLAGHFWLNDKWLWKPPLFEEEAERDIDEQGD